MFEYKKKWNYYWITGDKIKGEFWPFIWIFCRNKYIWNINNSLVDEKKYPWYKYSIWIYNNTLFIIWKYWIENIV